jgi:hypothetical protein
MQAIRDALILLVLILLAVSIRVTPLENVTDLIPHAQAATTERSADGARAVTAEQSSSCSKGSDVVPCPQDRSLSPPPKGSLGSLELRQIDDSRVMVLIEVERDGRLEAESKQCPTDSGRPQKAPAAAEAC